MNKVFFSITFIAVILLGGVAKAACTISQSNGRPAIGLEDALAKSLSSAETCPLNVQEFRQLLSTLGLDSKPSMVANRGRNNPKAGSFSLFERVTGKLADGSIIADGHFFYGHFTAAHRGSLVLDQRPSEGKLMIELIAWDSRKQLFNFYELIGRTSSAVWIYRGDSADILSDNQFLHMDRPAGAPQFGSRLRCSACHTSGGPIMKELASPHNDWWSNSRALVLMQTPEPGLASLIADLDGAEQFAKSVISGINTLERSPVYQSLKQQTGGQPLLRPLFCENEINLMSDTAPNERRRPVVQIPTSLFAHPRLTGAMSLSWPRANYENAMRGFIDTDHAAFLPVRAYSDEIAIESLLVKRIVDTEFVADVLAVDLENPLFSSARCVLLKLVPHTLHASWKNEFLTNLRRSGLPGAATLARNLTDPKLNVIEHRKNATERLEAIAKELQSPQGSLRVMENLNALRRAVSRSEISQNPRGQILEPGFRVIWPVPAGI